MGLVVLAMAFSYSFFFVIQALTGMNEGGLGLKIYSAILTFICIFSYSRDFIQKKEVRVKDVKYIWFLVMIIVLFYYTSVKYGGASKSYKGFFFSFGVRVVPTVLVALMCSKYDDIIDKAIGMLPFFMLLYTVAVIKVVANKSDSEYLIYVYNESGFNYQMLSYYSCYAYLMNLFFISQKKKINTYLFFKSGFGSMICFILIPVQLYCMLSGGGRGAVLLCIMGTLFIAIYCFRDKMKKKSTYVELILIAIIVYIALLFLTSREGVSLGIERLTNFFGNKDSIVSDQRNNLRSMSLAGWAVKPVLGWGIGATPLFFEFYSHNLFSDLLFETGLVGTGFIIISMIIALKKMFILLRQNAKYALVSIVFICGFLMSMFSGYYLSDSTLWFAVAYFLMKDTSNIYNNEERLHDCS